MTAHDHRTYVEGCFRCDLSRDEVGREQNTPHQAIADEFRLVHASNQPDAAAKVALSALAAAGYQVVTNDLVEAATELLQRQVAEDTCCDDCTPFVDPVRDRLAACLAAHRGDDELNVFTKGGA